MLQSVHIHSVKLSDCCFCRLLFVVNIAYLFSTYNRGLTGSKSQLWRSFLLGTALIHSFWIITYLHILHKTVFKLDVVRFYSSNKQIRKLVILQQIQFSFQSGIFTVCLTVRNTAGVKLAQSSCRTGFIKYYENIPRINESSANARYWVIQCLTTNLIT